MVVTKSFLWGLMVAVGCALGIIFTPDLDQEEAHLKPWLKLLSLGIHIFFVVLAVLVVVGV